MMSALPLQQKPESLLVNFDSIPQSLKDSATWVLWRYEQRDGGKWTKPPLQADGRYAKTTDPDTWTPIEEATTAYSGGGFDGVGVVLRDGLVGIDLDHVVTKSGKLEPWAAEIIDRFAGTYIEFSPSGDGIHILARGTLTNCGKAGPDNRLECYDQSSPRYFTMTGHEISEACGITEQQEAINWLCGTHFGDSAKNTANANVLQLPQTGVLADDDILAKAARAGNCDRFRKLFDNCDYSEFPSPSEADLALANMLAYWTQDSEQLDRLFQRSAIYRPEKWTQTVSSDGSTYGQATIAKALSGDSARMGADVSDILTGPSQESVAIRQRDHRFVAAADFMAESASVDWLIDGVLEQTATCTLFGASGSGKSFIALDWACCVATGSDWHGRDVAPGAAFYIVGEGQNGFKRRLKAWEHKSGISLTGMPLYLKTIPIPLSDGDNAKHLADEIEKLAVSSQPPRMIVIDTLARNFGSGDENSNTDVNRLIAKLDEHLRIRFNASVVIVHHSGNSEKDRARGASALKAAMDHEYRVDTRGDHRVLTCTKMKDGPEDLEFHFRIESVPLNGDETAGALVPLDVPSKKQTDTRLRPGSTIALGALRTITDIHGVAPDAELEQAVGMFPPALVVHKDKWKESAIEAGISKGTPDSERRAFDRAVEQLIAENLVGTHGEYYWVMG